MYGHVDTIILQYIFFYMTHMFIIKCMHKLVYTCICMYMCACAYMYMCVSMCMCIYACICVYMCA